MKEFAAEANAAGNVEQALEYALAAHASDRRDTEVIDLIIHDLGRLHRHEEAIEFIDSLDEDLRTCLNYRCAKAMQQVHLDDYQEASSIWSEYASKPPKDRPDPVVVVRIAALLRAREYAELLALIMSTPFRGTPQTYILNLAIESAIKTRKYSLAERWVTDMRSAGVAHPNLDIHEAELLRRKGRYAEALKLLESAKKANPYQLTIYAEMAICLMGLDRDRDAKDVLMYAFSRIRTEVWITNLLARLEPALFEPHEPTPDQFLDRSIFLLLGQEHWTVHCAVTLSLLPYRGRDMSYVLLQEGQQEYLASDVPVLESIRNVLPFMYHVRAARQAPPSHEESLAYLIMQLYMGSPAACYRGIDDVLMLSDQEPSCLQDYYYALSAGQILEDHGSIMDAALARAYAALGATSSIPVDLYYALSLLAVSGRADEAIDRLTALRAEGRSYLPFDIMDVGLKMQRDEGFMETEEGLQAIRELVARLQQAPRSFFNDPSPISVGAEESDLLDRLTPLFQFMENLEVMSHVSSYVREFQKERALDEVYFVRGSIFASLLRFESYEEVRGLGLVEEGTGNFSAAAVTWVSEVLREGPVVGDPEALAASYVPFEGSEVLERLGNEVFAHVASALHRREALSLEKVLQVVRRDHLIGLVLQRRGMLDIEQYLFLQHYCRYALEELVRLDTRFIQNEIKGQVDDQILEVLKQFDIVGTVLEFALGPIRPLYWICSKSIRAITKTFGRGVVDNRLLSFEQYVKYIQGRRDREIG